jgi:hypothetical protein
MVAARPATAGLGAKGDTVASRFDKVRVVLTALAPGVVLAAVGLPAVTAAAFAASGSTDLAAKPGSLVRVPADDRPIVRWWWPTANVQPAEIRAELRAMKGAGFGGVEQSLLANDLEWGSPTFRERTRTAVRAASALGLGFDVTLGPGWPMSSPATEDLSREISSQALHYGAVELDGPATFRGPVPDNPPSIAGQPRRLIAVTAIRVTAAGTPQTLDPTSAVDLTSTVRRDGTLSWSVPRGRWKLLGFWMRPSLMRAKNPGGGSQGWYVSDHFSARATGAVLGDYDRMLFGGDMAPLFRRNAGDVFEDSYEVEPGTAASGQSTVMWTPAMLSEFQRRRGYDLAPLLPGLFEEFTFPGELGARLERDVQVTLNDLLIARHLEVIAAWAHRKGLRSRAQAYQAGLGQVGATQNSRLAAAGQQPDVETLGFGDPNIGEFTAVTPGSADGRAVLDRYRQVVSGAHLSGQDEVTNEWGAVFNGQFRTRLEDLKAIADRSFAAGVTRMALHGFAYRLYDRPAGATTPRPNWPGWCAWCGGLLEFADSWNQRWPAFKALPSLTAYLGRAGAALRTGRPRIDLTVLSGTSVVNGLGVPKTAATPQDRLRRGLVRAGYTWDALDPLSVRRLGRVSGGRLLPSGPAYKALVVDDQRALPAATARRLVRLGRKGLPLVLYGRVPQAGAGFKDATSEDAAVKTAIARLRRLQSVRVARTPGALISALRALAVRPDLDQGSGATIVPVHRRTATGDVWFLYNDSTTPTTRRLTFTTGGAPTQLDLWTGAATRLGRNTRRHGRVTVPVTLPPAGTAVLTFGRRGARAGSSRRPLAGPRTVAGPWHLDATTVQPAGDRRVIRTVSRLVDWAQIPGLQGKSGTGVYTASVAVPSRWLRAGRGVLFGPGAFGGALRVWLNGHRAAVPAVAGAGPSDVTSLLRAGTNAVRLEISTTLDNAVRTQGLGGDPRYASYATRPVQPTGLTGPVQLTPYAVATR